MDRRSQTAFLALIASQAAHSLEEYAFRLFDVFGPARFVSALFSGNLETGFAVANTGVVLLGAGCYWAFVRSGPALALPIAWFWTVLEFANGIGHTLLALSRGSYFPGLATAPLLIAASGYMGYRLQCAPHSS